MKIGAIIKEIREKKGLPVEDVASSLKLDLSEYEKIEKGESEVEQWGNILAKLAIKLGTPTSRLISETGKYAQATEGACGTLITKHREKKNLTQEQMADLIEISPDELKKIEGGESPIEKVGPMLLQCAELVDQPVFNLLFRI